jgi:serine/threonine-protein kinase
VRARDTTGGTRTGALGSFLYGAPELIDQPQVADARADVYGLGMTAIFCIHGAELPAISGRDPEQVLKKLPCSEAVRSV